MKVSRNWLQKYFEKPLPNVAEIAEAFTFHAFEIEEAEDDILDVKVLPNRAADCFCHRGIAKELSAILDIPLINDPLRNSLPLWDAPWDVPRPTSLTVEIEDPNGFDKLTAGKCLRYMGAVVRGVKVAPSPAWLRDALEAVGQRSINNIVDAANYVMLDIGQPLHAFDAGSLDSARDKKLAIKVRSAKEGEKIMTLSGEEFTLTPNMLLITDANGDRPIGIAGIKGGQFAQVTANTTTIIIESANFDGTTTRRAAQALKLFTDASQRFQNRPSPELCAYGIRDVLALVTEVAGGEVEGVVDEYPARAEGNRIVSVSRTQVNGLLGSKFSKEEVGNVFKRLGLEAEVDRDTFTVTPPFERTDLTIPEDLVEEVVRIIGYEKITPVELSPLTGVLDQARFRGIERMKDQLVEQGFTEVSTQSFTEKGDITLANPFDKTKPMLRTSLEQNLNEALERAKRYAPLVLAPHETPKLFEVGTVFPKEGEYLELRTAPSGASAKEGDLSKIIDLEDYGKDYEPRRYELGPYKPFSLYPFIMRDIALWVPTGTKSEDIEKIIRDNAGPLLVRLDQFDRFEKEKKISYAFRLVFLSFDRTLTDDEVNGIMKTVSEALTITGHEVR